jgi:hypothetical protein
MLFFKGIINSSNKTITQQVLLALSKIVFLAGHSLIVSFSNGRWQNEMFTFVSK